MKTNKLYTALATVSFAFVAVSCELRPLEDPSDIVRIEVTIDTDNIPNVTSDIYNPRLDRPSVSTDMMRALFYNPITGQMVGQNFISDKTQNEKGQQVLSGIANIIQGQYNLVCYNFDMANTLTKDVESYNDATAYTSDVSTALKQSLSSLGGIEDKSKHFIYDPDHMFVSRDLDVVIKPHMDEYIIRTTAKPLIDTYYFQIRVDGSKKINKVSAVIDGLSPSNLFTKDIRNASDPSAVFFELQKDTDERIKDENKDVLCGLFSTFGKIEDANSDAYIIVTMIANSGEVFEKKVSLDEVFKTEDAKLRHWLILDDIIVIPDPPEPHTTGGFDPIVEDWEDIEETIAL